MSMFVFLMLDIMLTLSLAISMSTFYNRKVFFFLLATSFVLHLSTFLTFSISHFRPVKNNYSIVI